MYCVTRGGHGMAGPLIAVVPLKQHTLLTNRVHHILRIDMIIFFLINVQMNILNSIHICDNMK